MMHSWFICNVVDGKLRRAGQLMRNCMWLLSEVKRFQHDALIITSVAVFAKLVGFDHVSQILGFFLCIFIKASWHEQTVWDIVRLLAIRARHQDRIDDLFFWHERRLVDHLTGGPNMSYIDLPVWPPHLEAAFFVFSC